MRSGVDAPGWEESKLEDGPVWNYFYFNKRVNELMNFNEETIRQVLFFKALWSVTVSENHVSPNPVFFFI